MPFQFYCGYAVDLGVVFVDHMQDDILVSLVILVSMSVPVGRFHMNLHMASPEFVADLDFRLQEVGTRVGVAVACRHHFHRFAFRGLQILVG